MVSCSGSLVPSRCREGGALLSPSTLLRLLAALCGAGPALRAVPVFGCSTKARTWLRLHFVPSPARAAQAARSLTGALSPPWPQPQFLPALVGCVLSVFSCDPPGGCRPSRISGSLWEPENRLGACLQFGRECRLWGRVCPFPLPPASCLRWGWAGLQPASSSGLAQTLCSAGSVFWPANFLSLFCCLTV